MMNRMSFSETIFLFFLALIIFGPKKLPEIARQVGKYLNEFRRASNEFKAQIEHEISNLEVEKKRADTQTVLPPAPAPEGTAARTLPEASWTGDNAQPETSPAETAVGATETSSTDAPATLAASTDAPPAPVHTNEPATEALPSPASVTSSSSQESHA
jgi:sec-independent protein translocase protein TatB